MVDRVKECLPDKPKLAQMFENCFTNTIVTTIKGKEDGTTFVITGDIPAMWLRDSAAQVRPYLVLAAEDESIADMIAGLIERQMAYVLIDPYANAFNEGPTGAGHQQDLTAMNPWIWERKYEIDSLAYPIQLGYLLWKNSGSVKPFNETFRKAAYEIIKLWKVEQHHEDKSPYTFQRLNAPLTDTLVREGKGSETAYTGMTWSGFRPSDDCCNYGYLIPSNMFAVVALRYLDEIARVVYGDAVLAEEALGLADEIEAGIRKFGVYDHPVYGKIYAYETDGKGGYTLMDDANVPSLLALPYLGYTDDQDEIYRNTRRFILSEDNPYYYRGQAAEGIGSPHTPPGYIWHIALSMQGLTSSDREEKARMLQMIQDTDADTGLTHESFSPDDPQQFTRPWFSWSNMLFSELIMDYCGIRIHS
ncbi:glycoside hydrolase family 125 protein [Gorillibacterium timonense]|uniref:glycoside hydrolase family 125 protein n=1 Tax=Gorillibacterium timonense TaxID=1689269 RepID=UPI00071C3FB8|nr:glycoside hydrolase family 125 protein [Gorillibacterium timonense]